MSLLKAKYRLISFVFQIQLFLMFDGSFNKVSRIIAPDAPPPMIATVSI